MTDEPKKSQASATEDGGRQSQSPPRRSALRRWGGRFVRLVIILAVLAGAGAVSIYWMRNRPKPDRRRPARQAVLVEVSPVHVATRTLTVEAMGTVVPARELALAPRVGGRIVDLADDFLPGGRFAEGQVVARLDPNDYVLEVRRSKAELERRRAEVARLDARITQAGAEIDRAEANVALEKGQQAVARREYELFGEETAPEDAALMLRKPQLKIARAALTASEASKAAAEQAKVAAESARDDAEVALEAAKLRLERTEVAAPFNALVRSRNAQVGAQVSTGRTLASLVGTDEYWVRVLVPVDRLRRIDVPGYNSRQASEARVYATGAWGPDVHRAARVKRLMGDIEPQGRMAMLLVAVDDPLGLDRPPDRRHPLLLGVYVRVEIVGRLLEDAARVPRTALREGNTVWVLTPDGALDIRKVAVAWSDADAVYVTDGLADGEKLITSDLAAPVEGMALRVEPPRPATTKPAGGGGAS